MDIWNRTTKHEGSATDSLYSSGTYGRFRIGTQISYRRKALLASYRLQYYLHQLTVWGEIYPAQMYLIPYSWDTCSTHAATVSYFAASKITIWSAQKSWPHYVLLVLSIKPWIEYIRHTRGSLGERIVSPLKITEKELVSSLYWPYLHRILRYGYRGIERMYAPVVGLNNRITICEFKAMGDGARSDGGSIGLRLN